MKNERIRNYVDELIKRWNAPFVLRQDIAEFTKNVITYKGMANLESKGEGPRRGLDNMRIRRKVAYDVHELGEWLVEYMANSPKA